MPFLFVKAVCILMAVMAVVILFRSRIKLLGKILGSIIAILIALSSNGGNLVTDVIYVIANLVMLSVTVKFKMDQPDKNRKRD